MNNENFEIRLQRCVDGELSDAERAELLTQLECSCCLESWKMLALSFVENQVFARAFTPEPTPHHIEQTVVSPTIAGEKKLPVWNRQVRPWVSIAASLMVGAAVALLVAPKPEQQPGEIQLAANQSQQLGAGDFSAAAFSNSDLVPTQKTGVQSIMNEVSSPVANRSSKIPLPVMNVNLNGISNKDSPVSVPVYSHEHWQNVNQSQFSSDISDEVHSILASEGLQLNRELHWYKARLNDGREIFLPSERVRVLPAVQ